MSLTPKQKEAVEVLVGLCNSSKDPPTLVTLLREYTALEGVQLDYSGFRSITDFLQASDRFNLINHGGTMVVTAKLRFDSIHISMMVGKQKRDGKRGGPPTRVSSCN